MVSILYLAQWEFTSSSQSSGCPESCSSTTPSWKSHLHSSYGGCLHFQNLDSNLQSSFSPTTNLTVSSSGVQPCANYDGCQSGGRRHCHPSFGMKLFFEFCPHFHAVTECGAGTAWAFPGWESLPLFWRFYSFPKPDRATSGSLNHCGSSNSAAVANWVAYAVIVCGYEASKSA